MKNIFLSLMIFSTFQTMGQSPAIQWSRALGGTLDDMVLTFRPTADNGAVIGGVTASKDGDVSGSKGKGDIWVVKLDANGNKQWQKILGGSNEEQGAMVYPTSDGGYIVGGNTFSVSGDVKGAHGGMDMWVVKLNASGFIQWQKALGGNNNDEIVSLHLLGDGGFLVGGQTLSANGDINGHHGDYDIWFVKLSSTGSVLWTKTLGSSGTEKLYSVLPLADGGFVFGGYTNFGVNGDVTGFHDSLDLWVGRVNAAGNLLWNRALGGSRNEGGVFLPIQIQSNGNLVIGSYYGSTDGDLSGVGTAHGGWIICLDAGGSILWQKIFEKQTVTAFHVCADDGVITGRNVAVNSGWAVAITKLSSAGSEEWTQVHGGAGSKYLNLLQETAGGGFIGYGNTNNSPDVPAFHGAYDGWLIRLDGVGQKLWERAVGGSNNDFLQGRTAVYSQGIFPINTSVTASWQHYNPFIQANDGSFLIALSTGSSNGDINGFHYSSKSGVRFDIWVARINETIPSPILSSVRSRGYQHKLFPNPATGSLMLEISGEISQPVLVTFFNASGQLLHTISLEFSGHENSRIPVNISSLPSGVIYYTLRTQNFTMAGKFLKSK